MNGKHYRPKERTEGLYEGLENVLMERWAAQVKNVYGRGYEDGKQDGKAAEEEKRDQITDKAYEDGMRKAWWAAETVINMSEVDRRRIFDTVFMADIIRDRTPSTVISLLEQNEKMEQALEHDRYEREFAIGNIVHFKGNSMRLMVIRRYTDDEDGKEKFDAIDWEGERYKRLECDKYVWIGIHSNFLQLVKPDMNGG